MRDSSRLLSVSRSVSLPAKLMDSSIPAVTTPMMTTTTRSSSSVKPASRDARPARPARPPAARGATPASLGEVPVANVGVGAVAARLIVGAECEEVIGLSMRARICVLVIMPPGILGEPLDVGSVPVSDRRVVGLLDERLQAVVRGRIHGVVQAVLGECRLETLDVLLGLRFLGLVHLADDLRHDGGR